MTLETININGDDFVNVNDLINAFVESEARDCHEDIWEDVSTLSDEAVDNMTGFLISIDRRDLALMLKEKWVKKRFGGFFHE